MGFLPLGILLSETDRKTFAESNLLYQSLNSSGQLTSMRKTIYVLGNPYLKKDNKAVKLAKRLQKGFPEISFVHLDPTEGLPEENIKELIFIDSVVSIDKVTKFNDLPHFALSPRTTAHDYDLPIVLGLMKKLGKIKKITIIGIPLSGKINKLLKETKEILTTLS